MKRENELNVENIPYQKYRDSPTIKFYTNWLLYDSSFAPPRGNAELLIKDRVLPGSQLVEMLPDGSFKGSGERIGAKSLLFQKEEGKVLAKHLLSVKDGLLIKIPRGENKKFEILFVPPQSGSSHHHVRFELEEGSTAELALILTANKSEGAPMTTVEVLGKRASLKMWIISAFKGGGLPALWTRIFLEEGSKAEVMNVAIGGASNLVSSEIFIEGGGGGASMNSFLFASRGEKVDHITNIFNSSPHGSSRISAIGFSFGGTAVHRGKLKVSSNAIESENRLSSIIYREGDGARAYSIPSLEVESSDVMEASHETSVSPIPEEELFYLRSRGFSKNEALELIVKSSLMRVLEGLEVSAFENINALLKQAL